jgi:predicted phosphate transport protein (TIGR00153 family)
VFWGKGKKVEGLVLRHLRQVDESLAAFHGAVLAYVDDGDVETAKRLALETHNAEGKADDVRRQVERELLGGALLANSRRDILEMIEAVDRLANSGEAVLDGLLVERFEIPESIRETVREITERTAEIVVEVNRAIEALFRDASSVVEHTREVERLEGVIDRLERDALKAVFAMGIDLAHQLQLRDFVRQLVEISDRAEDLSDRLDILVAERVL